MSLRKQMKSVMTMIAVILLIVVGAAAAFAKHELNPGPWKNKPVMCNKAHIVVGIMQNSGENPIVWMDGEVFMPSGERPRSKFVIALNPEKETWTLIEFMNLITEGEKAGAYQDACILGVGQGKINFTLTTRKGIDL